jgi:hypothetical protein
MTGLERALREEFVGETAIDLDLGEIDERPGAGGERAHLAVMDDGDAVDEADVAWVSCFTSSSFAKQSSRRRIPSSRPNQATRLSQGTSSARPVSSTTDTAVSSSVVASVSCADSATGLPAWSAIRSDKSA